MKPTRLKLTQEEVEQACDTIKAAMISHLVVAGDGAFVSPHEAVGCLHGQLHKLSVAADETIYSKNTDQYEQRLIKTALATAFALASAIKYRK